MPACPYITQVGDSFTFHTDHRYLYVVPGPNEGQHLGRSGPWYSESLRVDHTIRSVFRIDTTNAKIERLYEDERIAEKPGDIDTLVLSKIIARVETGNMDIWIFNPLKDCERDDEPQIIGRDDWDVPIYRVVGR